MSRLFVFGAAGAETSGKLDIVNETICTLKKVHQRSQQMLNWKDAFPMEIEPNSHASVQITFDTKSSIPFHLDRGEVSYEVVDNTGLTLGEFTIKANADQSYPSCCCCWTFKGHIEVDWDTVPKVFGVMVAPRDGATLGFKIDDTVSLNISGKVLPGGPRSAQSGMKVTDWKHWEEIVPDCTPGDVIGADRQAYKHYGVVHSVEDDRNVKVCHLSGTAEDVLSTHGLGGAVREVWAAMQPGSHGGIASVALQDLKDFAGEGLCRIENIHEDHWKPYNEEFLMKRMSAALGNRDYSLFEFNCEHFANLVRYGMPYSAQIEAINQRYEQDTVYYEKSAKQMSEAMQELRSRHDQWATDMSQKATEAAAEISKEWTRFSGGAGQEEPGDKKQL